MNVFRWENFYLILKILELLMRGVLIFIGDLWIFLFVVDFMVWEIFHSGTQILIMFNLIITKDYIHFKCYCHFSNDLFPYPIIFNQNTKLIYDTISVQSFQFFTIHFLRHKGQSSEEPSSVHFKIQCKWKWWRHCPWMGTQSSPGTLHLGQGD